MRIHPGLIESNVALLGQALALLDRLPDELYSARPDCFERGGVGSHLRHVLDHYDAWLQQAEAAPNESLRIDYDARLRDPATEVDPNVGRARLRATIARLRGLEPRLARDPSWTLRELPVAMELNGRGSETSVGRSTLGRELQYLVAHTVHHYALIAVALRSMGRPVPAEFGVAPSTLRHDSELAAGARTATSPSDGAARSGDGVACAR